MIATLTVWFWLSAAKPPITLQFESLKECERTATFVREKYAVQAACSLNT